MARSHTGDLGILCMSCIALRRGRSVSNHRLSHGKLPLPFPYFTSPDEFKILIEGQHMVKITLGRSPFPEEARPVHQRFGGGKDGPAGIGNNAVPQVLQVLNAQKWSLPPSIMFGAGGNRPFYAIGARKRPPFLHSLVVRATIRLL